MRRWFIHADHTIANAHAVPITGTHAKWQRRLPINQSANDSGTGTASGHRHLSEYRAFGRRGGATCEQQHERCESSFECHHCGWIARRDVLH